MQQRIIYALLHEAAERWGDTPALHQPGKQPRVWTWRQYRDAVNEIAAGLHALGVQRGDMVAIHAETRAEFYLADLGTMTAGAVAAALYTSYPVRDQVKTLQKIGVKLLFVENEKVLRAFRDNMPESAPPMVVLTGGSDGAMSLDELQRQGRAAIAADTGLLARLHEAVQPEDYAMLYLTSGATGEPKMGLVTHFAMVRNLEMAREVITIGPDDRTLAFLPSAHITQRLAMECLAIAFGMPTWFSEGLTKLPHEMRAVKPTFFVAPPRLWERIYTSINTEIRKKPMIAQRLVWGALGAGLRASKAEQAGETVPGWVQTARALSDKVVFAKIRERLGGAVRIAVSGSAPLSKDIAHFYAAIGMPLVEGYGLTEGGVTMLNPLDQPKIGSIGKAFPGVQLRLGDDGELLIKADCVFAGYLNDAAATAAVLRDGWLHTGDIAEIDRDGFVYITGRKKEVIVASNGKKIYPAKIEGLFKTQPLINQVLLVGDRLPFVGALMNLNMGVVESLPGMESYQGKATQEVLDAPPVKQAVDRVIAQINRELADFEKIRKYKLLDREFTVDSGELTPTMKVRRSKVLENYRALVNELYAGKEEFV